jgi:hypothetical protein
MRVQSEIRSDQMRNVRNAWVTLDVDGRSEPVATGPRTKNGSMNVAFRVRDHGESVPSITVDTYADGDRLVLRVVDEHGNEVYRQETVR